MLKDRLGQTESRNFISIDRPGCTGGRVAVHGDMAAVGDPTFSNEAGAVYLFRRTGDQWILQSAPASGEGGGEEPPPEGDGEEPSGGGDGEAPPDSSGASSPNLTPSDSDAWDSFGTSLALDAEYAIVGAQGDDDKGYASGSAYIFPLFSASISADPSQIQLGGEEAFSATLSWSARGADSVRIDPDIGPVAATGQVTVTPPQTTTYTISATKDGVTLTDSVTVTVIDPSVAPTVTLSAAPETMVRGETATLSWSATDVASVTLDHQIGALPMAGDLTVSPSQTTTYTATATNGAGTVTASTTITVTDPPPIVELTVEPAQILTGDSATLTWNTTYAATVSIDQGIGAVATADLRVVAPGQTTTYTLTATGSGGTTTASATLTVTNPISLAITDPAEGADIPDTTVTVRGTLSHARGLETGLTVNGVPVIIDGDQFIANHVPLAPGENTLTAMATDTDGITFSDAVTVNAQYPEDYVRLSASPVSGTAPFETRLQIDSELPIATYQFYHDGTGEVTFLDLTSDGARVEIAAGGVYTFSVDVTDRQGDTHTDSITVEVVDEAALDSLLQDKWSGMKTALLAGDFNNAVTFFISERQNAYNQVFNDLSDEIGDIITATGALEALEVSDRHARYTISYPITVDGVTTTAGTYVIFVQDTDGLWKIRFF